MEVWNIKQISPNNFDSSPPLTPPAGYVCFLRDVSYGNRYQIRVVGAPAQLSRHLAQAFEVEAALVFQADDAERFGRELLEFAGGASADEWFDLADDQFQSLRELGLAGQIDQQQQRQSPRLSSLLEGSEPSASRPRSASHRHVNRATAVPSRRSARPSRQRSTAHRTTTRATTPPAPERSDRAAQPRRRNRGTKLLFILFALMILGGLYGAITERDPVADLGLLVETARAVTVNTEPTATFTATEPPPTATFTATEPPPTATFTATEPPPTAKPTRIPATAVGQGEEFYVKADARARICAREICAAGSYVQRGDKITAQKYTKGQSINGSDRWIRYINEGRILFIHSSFLSRDKPEAEPTKEPSPTATDLPPTPTVTATDPPPTATFTATEPPPTATYTSTATSSPEPSATSTWTPVPSATSSQRMVVETRNGLGANARACPWTSCEIIDTLRPGHEIFGLGRVEGEEVYGSTVWVQFEIEGLAAYIHSELIEAKR